MPTLRRYVPSSEKTGFYIQANVGAGAPVTLQVSELAGRVFTENGYGDDDTVPTKLVWAMYDVGLVSTGESKRTGSKSANVYKAFTGNGVSSRLSERTRTELVEYLDDYRGSQQRRVRRLRNKLADGGDEAPSNSTTRVDTSDLGHGFVDSLRIIWRHFVAWLGR